QLEWLFFFGFNWTNGSRFCSGCHSNCSNARFAAAALFVYCIQRLRTRTEIRRRLRQPAAAVTQTAASQQKQQPPPTAAQPADVQQVATAATATAASTAATASASARRTIRDRHRRGGSVRHGDEEPEPVAVLAR
uniref:Zf-3CxxC domain-containing protein n=1 Tax=Macrostomum lignano TaxID=282301 RepID=A0A1I8HDR4_9PLAT